VEQEVGPLRDGPLPTVTFVMPTVTGRPTESGTASFDVMRSLNGQ
jgi:hypothetical protein